VVEEAAVANSEPVAEFDLLLDLFLSVVEEAAVANSEPVAEFDHLVGLLLSVTEGAAAASWEPVVKFDPLLGPVPMCPHAHARHSEPGRTVRALRAERWELGPPRPVPAQVAIVDEGWAGTMASGLRLDHSELRPGWEYLSAATRLAELANSFVPAVDSA
jgi:hypothetical protein